MPFSAVRVVTSTSRHRRHVHERADLDAAVLRIRDVRCELDGAIERFDIDDVIAAEVFLGLGEGTVGDVLVALTHADRGGGPSGVEALAGDEVRSRNVVGAIEQANGGMVPNIALAPRLSETPLAAPTPAPRLGQHSIEILCDRLGRSPAEIEQLLASGAVKAGN